MDDDCVFCDIVTGRRPAAVLREWPDALAFEPLNPVTRGHLLVIPKAHVTDASVDPVITASVVARAAGLAWTWHPCNLITSCGPEATQTVMHLHVHVIPRRPGDGLLLPWSEREEAPRG